MSGWDDDNRVKVEWKRRMLHVYILVLVAVISASAFLRDDDVDLESNKQQFLQTSVCSRKLL